MKTQALLLLSLISCLTALGCAPETAKTDAGNTGTIAAQEALAGVGKQGQSLRDQSGAQKILSGPLSAYLHVKQLAELEIKIPHALNLFQATHGRFPKSHEEFMKEIVEFNQIKLPELPTGAVYRFNTQEGKLWVYPEDEAP